MPHASEVVEQASIQAQAIVDSAVNDANGDPPEFHSVYETTCSAVSDHHQLIPWKGQGDVLTPLCLPCSPAMTLFPSNRNELSGGIVRRPEEGRRPGASGDG